MTFKQFALTRRQRKETFYNISALIVLVVAAPARHLDYLYRLSPR